MIVLAVLLLMVGAGICGAIIGLIADDDAATVEVAAWDAYTAALA